MDDETRKWALAYRWALDVVETPKRAAPTMDRQGLQGVGLKLEESACVSDPRNIHQPAPGSSPQRQHWTFSPRALHTLELRPHGAAKAYLLDDGVRAVAAGKNLDHVRARVDDLTAASSPRCSVRATATATTVSHVARCSARRPVRRRRRGGPEALARSRPSGSLLVPPGGRRASPPPAPPGAAP